jgi:hypothetical protein
MLAPSRGAAALDQHGSSSSSGMATTSTQPSGPPMTKAMATKMTDERQVGQRRQRGRGEELAHHLHLRQVVRVGAGRGRPVLHAHAQRLAEQHAPTMRSALRPARSIRWRATAAPQVEQQRQPAPDGQRPQRDEGLVRDHLVEDHRGDEPVTSISTLLSRRPAAPSGSTARSGAACPTASGAPGRAAAGRADCRRACKGRGHQRDAGVLGRQLGLAGRQAWCSRRASRCRTACAPRPSARPPRCRRRPSSAAARRQQQRVQLGQRRCTRPALKPASRSARTAWSGASGPATAAAGQQRLGERSRPWWRVSQISAAPRAAATAAAKRRWQRRVASSRAVPCHARTPPAHRHPDFHLRRQARADAGERLLLRRDERLFLVTSRHVVIDEPSKHHPDRIEIELHTDAANLTQVDRLSMLLYRDGRAMWRQGKDAGRRDRRRGDRDRARRAAGHGIALQAFTPGAPAGLAGRHRGRQQLLIVGFPLGFHDTLHHLPVVRQAVIASSFGMRFQGQGYFLTDARTHRGTSGAPVVMRDPAPHAPWATRTCPGSCWACTRRGMDMPPHRDLVLDESLGPQLRLVRRHPDRR